MFSCVGFPTEIEKEVTLKIIIGLGSQRLDVQLVGWPVKDTSLRIQMSFQNLRVFSL